MTRKDVLVSFVTGIGETAGRLEEHGMVLRDDATLAMSAIQLSTDSGCVAMVELFLAGKLPHQGFVRQDDSSLADVLAPHAGSRLASESVAPMLPGAHIRTHEMPLDCQGLPIE